MIQPHPIVYHDKWLLLLFWVASMVYQLKHQNSINSSNSRENLAHPLRVNNPWICYCTEGFVSQTHLKISIFYTKMSHSVNTVSVQASCIWQKIVASGNWKKWKKSFRKNSNFDKRSMFLVPFEVFLIPVERKFFWKHSWVLKFWRWNPIWKYICAFLSLKPNLSVSLYKVHMFWEGHKILRNLNLTFVLCSANQK